LDEAASASDKRWGLIPSPIYRGVTWLNKKALQEEGLYRIPGNHQTIEEYVRLFDEGQDIDFFARDERLPENVTGVIIRFLKKTPNLLGESKSLVEQISQIEDAEVQASRIKALLLTVPPSLRETLHVFGHHLSLVLANEQLNRMSASVLETTFRIMMGPVHAWLFVYIATHMDTCPSFITFGVPLEVSCRLSANGLIPNVLESCFHFIESGRYSQDLYLAAGSWLEVAKYQRQWNEGTFLAFPSDLDVDVVATLVRHYVFELPHNLVTSSLRDAFKEACDQAQLAVVKDLLSRVPPCHAATLKRLVQHLALVLAHSEGHIASFQLGSVFGGAYRSILPQLIDWYCDPSVALFDED